jgi:hypothetical protein
MKVSIEIPDITDFPNGFPGYWLNNIFKGSISLSYSTNALVTTYIRLVEAALTEYRLGQVRLREFWNTHDSLNLGAIHKSIAHFEACLTDMHRAIRCFNRLRKNRNVPQEFRIFLSLDKLTFVADNVTDRLKNMRDAIHHIEEKVFDGTILDGSSFTLRPDGPETPISDEPGQSLKLIDRLTIGDMEITFSELAKWLVEMGHQAEKISGYKPEHWH